MLSVYNLSFVSNDQRDWMWKTSPSITIGGLTAAHGLLVRL